MPLLWAAGEAGVTSILAEQKERRNATFLRAMPLEPERVLRRKRRGELGAASSARLELTSSTNSSSQSTFFNLANQPLLGLLRFRPPATHSSTRSGCPESLRLATTPTRVPSASSKRAKVAGCSRMSCSSDDPARRKMRRSNMPSKRFFGGTSKSRPPCDPRSQPYSVHVPEELTC